MSSLSRVAAVLTGVVSLSAFAAGTTLPYEHPRELALSEAAVANQTGPQAIFLNPAALASQEGFAAAGAAEWLYNYTQWSDPNLGSAKTVPKLNVPVAGSLSYSKTLNGIGFGVGAGLEITNGASLVWPNYWPGAQRVQTVKQQIYGLQVGAAIKPLSFISAGVTVYYYRAIEDLTQRIGFVSQTGEAIAGLAGGQFSWGGSLQIDIPKTPLSFAINYRHKANIDLHGHVDFRGVPVTFGDLLQDQAVSHRFTVPNILSTGFAVKLPKNITVMGAYTFERWIEYRDDTFVGEAGFTLKVPRNYRNGHVFRLAGEWNEVGGTGLSLRLGALRSQSPQPSDTVSPTLTDGNSWAFSTGLGYTFAKSFSVDLGYQHAFFDRVTATGPEAFPGTYNTNVDLLSLGVSMRLK